MTIIYIQVILLILFVLVSLFAKSAKRCFKITISLILLSIFISYFHVSTKTFESSTEQSRVIHAFFDQIEIIKNDPVLLNKYLNDLRKNAYILQYNCENGYSGELFKFLGVWERLLSDDKLIKLKYYDILIEDSSLSKILNKHGDILIDEAEIYLNDDYPFIYGKYNVKGVVYNFIVDLRTDTVFKQEDDKVNVEYANKFDEMEKAIKLKKLVPANDYWKYYFDSPLSKNYTVY